MDKKTRLVQLVKNLKNFEDQNYFLKWYDNQPISAKLGFFSATIIALLTHIIMYSNLILEEHLAGFARPYIIHQSGRWFHHQVNSLTFFYMNWASGLLQVLFLALVVSIVIKAFDIQNRVNALLISGVMVTFPTIAETNLYFHDAAPYFFAALLSIVAFYVTKIYKLGWIIGAIFIMLSLAIYQSKISLAMTASLVYLIIYVLKEDPKFLDFVKYAIRYFLLIVGGLIAYYVSLQLLDMSPQYRGMGDLSLSSIYRDILRAYREVHFYFFSNSFRIDNRYLIFAYAFIALMNLLLFTLAIKKAVNKNILNITLVAILALLLPLAANFSRVLDSGGIYVLTMTTYAFTILLILPLIIFENFQINTYGLKKLVAIALIFIIGYYISFSNFIYQRGEVMTMHVMQLANRISARVELLLPYSDSRHLFVLGNLAHNPIYPNTDINVVLFPEYAPRTVRSIFLLGGNNDFSAWPINFFENVIRFRIGLDVIQAGNNERRQYLLDRAITYGMPVYPLEGSVALIDGVVVAMLNFFGRLDVEEISHNNFIATANHTGKASNLGFEYIWYIYRDGQRLEQIYRDYDGRGYLNYEIHEPGSYQFRVFIHLPSGVNVANNFSPHLEVE